MKVSACRVRYPPDCSATWLPRWPPDASPNRVICARRLDLGQDSMVDRTAGLWTAGSPFAGANLRTNDGP